MSDDRQSAPSDLERELSTLELTLGPLDPKTMLVRSNLAIQHRNTNHPERADALFARIALCEHLRPLVEALRGRGLHVLDVSRPWSDNCRAWMYFADVVLDVDALKSRLHLPACVEAHRHRGTVDGAEQGLVCRIDHDAVMGMHPEVAGPGTRVIA